MYILLITYAVLLVMFFIKKDEINTAIGSVLGYLRPFFYAIVIAYILNLPMVFIERRIVPWLFRRAKKHNPARERGVAVALAMFFALAIVTAIFSVLIPQLVDSISLLVNNMGSYVESLEAFVNNLGTHFNLSGDRWQKVLDAGAEYLNNLVTTIQNSVPTIVDKAREIMTAFLSGVFNILMSLIISAYLLFHKEKLTRQVKTVLRAFLPDRVCAFIHDTVNYADDVFTKFIGGQLTESLILSVLCYIGTLILRTPYALLVSVIVGITNLIPIFGPWIGTAICAFLLVMVSPVRALWFVVFIIILQQLENNLIYPKIVGSSIGMSGLWVIFAITLGGGLFGIWGIFLGIPMFAVVSRLLRDWVRDKGAKKRAAQSPADGAPADSPDDPDAGEAAQIPDDPESGKENR